MSENDDASLLHKSIDLNLKYNLDAFVAAIFGNSTKYFSPFAYVGGGYTALDGDGEGVLNYGFGLMFGYLKQLVCIPNRLKTRI